MSRKRSLSTHPFKQTSYTKFTVSVKCSELRTSDSVTATPLLRPVFWGSQWCAIHSPMDRAQRPRPQARTFPNIAMTSAKARWCWGTLLPTFTPTDCSPRGSSIHGVLQARILERVAVSFSRGSSRPRDQIHVSGIGKRVLHPEHHLGSPFQPQKPIKAFLGGGFSRNWRWSICCIGCSLPTPCPRSTVIPQKQSSPWLWHTLVPLPKPFHCASEDGVLHFSQAAEPCEPSEGLLEHRLEGLTCSVSDSVSPG